MNLIATLRQTFALWMDCVAHTAIATGDRLRTYRKVQLIEDDNGTFAFRLVTDGDAGKRRSGRSSQKTVTLPPHHARIVNGKRDQPLPDEWAAALRGSRIELMLRANHFLFRPLELPKRAVDFLDGIVRAQIDRLTPWNAAGAVFSWSPPSDSGGDRIRVIVVATALTIVGPYMAALADLGGASVSVVTAVPDASAAPIVVFTQNAGGEATIERIRRVLATVFLATGMAAVASYGICAVAGDHFDAAQQTFSRKIVALRATMNIDASDNSTLHNLARRKQMSTSSVIVLEALSQILPDHTYVTELRIDGDRMQIVGLTADAPSLIRLIELSPHFTRATFFAPTTQGPGDPGERFHIEARIKPDFTLGT
jgi:general secretion pathway protein L